MLLAIFGIGTSELIILMGCCTVPLLGVLVTAVIVIAMKASDRPRE